MLSAISGMYVQSAFQSARKYFWKLVFPVALLIGITIGSAFLIKSFRPDLAGLGYYGYLGTFVIAFVMNAPLFFPMFLIGAVLPLVADFANQVGLFWVVVIYAFGATLGESVGYGFGMKGQNHIKFPWFFGEQSRGQAWFVQGIKRIFLGKRKTWVWIVFLTIVPFPPFDVVGLIAGSRRYSFKRFFTACFVGRVIKYLFLFGATGLVWNWVMRVT